MSACVVRHERRVTGFTLVELLVVVSIIALLISILLPSLRNAREQAKAVKCLAHERGMAQAGMTFAQDHNDRFQLVADGNGNTEADPGKKLFAYGATGELLGWPVALGQMMAKSGFKENSSWGTRADTFADALTRTAYMKKNLEVATCPSDKVRVATPFYPNSGQLNAADPTQPANGGLYWGYLSFGINEDLCGATDAYSLSAPPVGRYDSNNRWAAGQRSLKAGTRLRGDLGKVFDPGTVLLIVDGGADDTGEAQSTSAANGNRNNDVVNLIISAQAGGPLLRHSMDKWPQRVPTKRHGKGAVNVVFADFHGVTVKPTTWGAASANQNVQVPTGHSTLVRVSPYKITGNMP